MRRAVKDAVARRAGLVRGRWIALAMLLRCAPEPATQIVVRLQTDMGADAGLVRVNVRAVRILGELIGERRFTLGGSPGVTFPGQVRLVPRDPDDPRPVRVEVTAQFSTPALDFTQSAVVSFRPGKTQVLYMVLPRWCTVAANRDSCSVRGSTCGWTRSTGPGCEPVERQRLPELADTDANDDPGFPCTICGGRCADLDADPRNCGACGRSCAADPAARITCNRGECVCEWNWGRCNDDPSDGCETSLVTDANCGSCGRACSLPMADARCRPDHCADGSNCSVCEVWRCRVGFDDCNNDRSDGCETATAQDALNCGRCRVRCATGHTCRDGTCVPPS